MKFIRENWSSLLTVLFLVVIGVLLLVNPILFSVMILRVAGGLLAILGIYDLIKYFKANPEEAAKGSGFYSGLVMVTAGLFCLFRADTLLEAFPVLAVLYGIFQIVLGYRKLQRMVDALRFRDPLWWMKAVSAGLSLIFGYLIAFNPEMTWMSIWVFTGITMILEGIFDGVAMVTRQQNEKEKTELK